MEEVTTPRRAETDPNFKKWVQGGLLFLMIQDYREALRQFTEALKISPENTEVLYFQSIANRSSELPLNLHQETLLCAEEMLKLDPNEAMALQFKSQMMWHMGNYDESIELADQLLEIDPKWLFAWLEKAEALRRQSKYNEALRCCDEFIAVDEKSGKASFGFSYSLKGIILFCAGNYQEAAECFHQALTVDVTEVFALQGQAFCTFYNGEAENAEKILLNVDEKLTKNLGPYINEYVLHVRGDLFLVLKQFARAKEVFEKIKAATPYDFYATERLAYIADCERFFLPHDLPPGYPPLRLLGATRGELEEKALEGRHQEVVNFFAQPLTFSPLYSIKGFSLFCLGRFEEAEKCFNDELKNIEINWDKLPHYQSEFTRARKFAIQGQAICLWRQGEKEAAEKLLEEVDVDFKENNLQEMAEILWQRGELFWRMGEFIAAEKTFKNVPNIKTGCSFQARGRLKAIATLREIGRIDDKMKQAVVREYQDATEINGILLQLGEIRFNQHDKNSYYTADFINALVCCRLRQEQDLPIYVEPAVVEMEGEYFDHVIGNILAQDKAYAFIPLCVAYDRDTPHAKNHWVAVVVDKRNQKVFYLDPAQQTPVPRCVLLLQERLGFTGEIVQNPFDFQQKEKIEGFVRHCGAYVVEIFEVFEHLIRDERMISQTEENGIGLEAALSRIPCGEADSISQIRKKHAEGVQRLLDGRGDVPVAQNPTVPSNGSDKGKEEADAVPEEKKEKTLNKRQGYDLEKATYQAAREGNIQVLQECLEDAMDLNCQTGSLRYPTPLMTAVYFADLKSVQWLVESGADPLLRERNGASSLEVAIFYARKDKLEKINYLLGVGCTFQHEIFRFITLDDMDNFEQCISSNLNLLEITDSCKRTALHYACAMGNVAIVQRLLEVCPALLVQSREKIDQPLHLAARNGHVEVVRYLIELKNISPSEVDGFENPPSFYAAENGRVEVVRYLVEERNISPSERGWYGYTLLTCAVENGQLDVVKYLLEEKNVSVCEKDGHRRTPLLLAAAKGHLDIVRYLVEEKNVSLVAKEANDLTALMCASQEGHVNVVRYLVEEKNVSPTERGPRGITALLSAAENNRLDVVRYLIEEQHVSPGEMDNQNRTPLLIAAEKGYLDLVRYLIEKQNVSPSERNIKGRTPLLAAAAGGHLDVVKYLIEVRGVSPSEKHYHLLETPLLFAARNHRLDVVKYLVDERNVPLDEKNDRGDTAFFVAAMSGGLEVVKYLVEEKNFSPDEEERENYPQWLKGEPAPRLSANCEAVKFWLEFHGFLSQQAEEALLELENCEKFENVYKYKGEKKYDDEFDDNIVGRKDDLLWAVFTTCIKFRAVKMACRLLLLDHDIQKKFNDYLKSDDVDENALEISQAFEGKDLVVEGDTVEGINIPMLAAYLFQLNKHTFKADCFLVERRLVESEHSGNTLLRSAVNLMSEIKYAEALVCVERVLEQESEQMFALSLKVILLLKQGKIIEALDEITEELFETFGYLIKGCYLDVIWFFYKGNAEKGEQCLAQSELMRVNDKGESDLVSLAIHLFIVSKRERAEEILEKIRLLNLSTEEKEYLQKFFAKLGIALFVVQKTPELNPKEFEALVLEAMALIRCGKYNEGLALVEKVMEGNLEDPAAWFLKSTALIRSERHEEGLEAAEKAIQIDPEYSDAWRMKSEALLKCERHTEALEAAEKAVECNPDEDAWRQKSYVLIMMGRYTEASEAAQKAIYAYPADMFARQLKAMSLILQGDKKERQNEEDGEELLIKIDAFVSSGEGYVLTRLTELWNQRGDIFFAVKEYVRAKEMFEKSQAADPTDFYSQKRLKELEVAQLLSNCVRNEHGGVEATPESLWLSASGEVWNIKKSELDDLLKENTEEILRKVHAKEEGWFWSIFNGIAWAVVGNYSRAIQYAEALLENDDDFDAAWFLKANCLRLQGHYAEAISIIDEIIDSEPPTVAEMNLFRNWNAYVVAADCYMRMGEYEHALRCVEQALSETELPRVPKSNYRPPIKHDHTRDLKARILMCMDQNEVSVSMEMFEEIRSVAQEAHQPQDETPTVLPELPSESEKKGSLECRYKPKDHTAPGKKPGCLFVLYPIMGGMKELGNFIDNMDKTVLDKNNLAVYLWWSPMLEMDCEAANFHAEWESFCSMEKQAEIAIAGIRSAQPHGPYYLCGWSYGGALTLEVARQLQRDGEDVEYIALIDPQTPAELRSLKQESLKRRLLLHINYISKLRLKLSEDLIDLDDADGKDKIELIKFAFKKIFDVIEEHRENPGFRKLRITLHTLYANYLAIYQYHPEAVLPEGKKLPAATVYVASDKAAWIEKKEYSFNDFAGVTEVKLSETVIDGAHHFDIVETPQMANLFTKHLENIGEIKLSNQLWLHLKRHYQTLEFSSLQFLYDDKPFDVRGCRFNVSSSSSGVQLDTLFDEDTKMRHTLVVGDAGVGKTVLARQLTLQNIDSKLWKQKKWIFYIPLHTLVNVMAEEEHALSQADHAIESLLYHGIFKVFGVKFEQVVAFWKFINKEPRPICFILDGLDEIPQEVGLDNALRALSLQNCAVVMTTRNYQLGRLRAVGFNSEAKFRVELFEADSLAHSFVPDYFESLGAPEKAVRLLGWLQENPVMREFVQNPLHLTMMCSIWSRFEREIVGEEKRLLDVFNLTVKNMFRRFLVHDRLAKLMDLNNLTDAALDEMTQDVSAFLQKCAFERVRSDSKDLTSSQINELLKSFEGGRNFFSRVLGSGFLQATQYAQYDIDRSFQFNHRAMELYFGCQYVARWLNTAEEISLEERQQLRMFIAHVRQSFESGLIEALLVAALNTRGRRRFVFLVRETVEDVPDAKSVSVLTHALDEAEMEIPAELGEILYCFTSYFAHAYEARGKKERADLESMELVAYKEWVGALRERCPQVFQQWVTAENFGCEYKGKEGVLHYAVRRRSVPLLKLLLTLNPDATFENDEKMSPLVLARRLDFSEGVELLKAYEIRKVKQVQEDAEKEKFRQKAKKRIIENYIAAWREGKAPELDHELARRLALFERLHVNGVAAVKEVAQIFEMFGHMESYASDADFQAAVCELICSEQHASLARKIFDFYDEIFSNKVLPEKDYTVVIELNRILLAARLSPQIKENWHSVLIEAVKHYSQNKHWLEGFIQKALKLVCTDNVTKAIVLTYLVEKFKKNILFERSALAERLKALLFFLCEKTYKKEIMDKLDDLAEDLVPVDESAGVSKKQNDTLNCGAHSPFFKPKRESHTEKAPKPQDLSKGKEEADGGDSKPLKKQDRPRK